jgi:hypothetical protein
MSTGSVATPLLKAAPRPEQIAERLEGGPWAGMELCLMAADVADEAALGRAVRRSRRGFLVRGSPSPPNAPVAWPSGAFVRVDRLDDEARAGIERSARFAAAVGSPVLTVHLFVPLDPAAYREVARSTRPRSSASCASTSTSATPRGSLR